MGAKCTGTCVRGQHERPKQFRDCIPDDIDQYNPSLINNKLPKLSIQGTISNIRILNCPEFAFSLKIKIDDVIEIDLPKRKVEPVSELKKEQRQQFVYAQNELKWLSRQKLSFMMDEYELRTRFVNVYIYDDEKSIQSHIRVNLFAIVTGPYRHDFYVCLKDEPARLLFELNLSEKIEAKLEALDIDIELQKSYLGEEFKFSLKQLTHGEVISTSKVSNSENIPLELTAQSSCYKELSGNLEERIDSPTLKRKKGKNNVIMLESKSTLRWFSNKKLFRAESLEEHIILKTVTSERQKQKRKLPHLKVHILSNEIMKSIIQFDLWIQNKKKAIIPIKTAPKDSIMFGQAQVSLYKIFDESYEEIQAKIVSETQIQCPSFKLEVREFVRQQHLKSKDGETVGKCRMRFRLTNPKFLKQMIYCAKTQDGIINMTTAFKNYSGKNAYPKNPMIKEIVSISEKIHGLAKRLSVYEATIGVQRREIINLQDQIYEQFEQMNQQLINSFDSSFVIPSSNLQTELLEAQSALIQVLEQIYVFLVQKNSIYTDICWEVAVNIYKMGDFYLENVGFKDLSTKKIPFPRQIEDKKLDVALRFKCVLYKYLMMALQQDDIKKQSGKILWSECFKAFAYFRVPIFRTEIVAVMQRQEDDNVIEWQIRDFDELSSFSSRLISDNQKSTNHMDWKCYFYDPLESKEQAIKLDRELIDLLEMNKWIKRLSRRESDFYYFVGYLVKILAEIGKMLKIMKWKYFPGYTKIVRSFLIEMKKKPLSEYTSTMIHASKNLLVNEDLINILLPLVTKKINLNSTSSLTRGLNIVWSYFTLVTNHCKIMMPVTFNYLYFFKIIKLVLESDNSFAIAKMLALVEKFFKSFNQEFKENIAMYMMGKVFFKLFFHWSFTIRMIFHIIFVARIYFHLIKSLDDRQIQSSKTKESFIARHQLQEKYFKIQHLIFSAEYLKKEELNDGFLNYCFKDLHKKMKKKLLARSRGSKSIISQNPHEQSSMKHQEQYLIKNLLKYDRISKQKTSFFIFNPTQKALGKSHFGRIQSNEGSIQSDEAIIEHGDSYGLNSKGIDKCLNKFDSGKEQDSESNNEIENSFEQKIRKQRTTTNNTVSQHTIGTRKMSQNQAKPDRFRSIKVQVTQSRIRKKASYSYFGHSDNQLQELTDTQIKEILVAMNEYRVTESQIEKFVKDNGRAPEFDLNVQLDKDGEFQPDLLKWSFDQS